MSRFFKAVGHNAWGEFLSRIPIMLAQIIIAKVLGPAVFGVWSFIQVIVNYNNLSSFGLNSALAVEEPIAIGQEKNNYAAYLRGTVFTSTTIITVLLTIFIIGFALICPIEVIRTYQTEVILIGLLLIAQQMFIFFQTTFQNNFNFSKLSISLVVFGFSYLVCTVCFIYKFGLSGVLLSWLVSFICAISCFCFLSPNLRPNLVFSKKLTKKLFKIGLPLYLAALVKIGFTSIDKFSIGLILGAEQLGLYNISFLMITILLVLSGLISRVVAPYLLHGTGLGFSGEEICIKYLRIMRVTNSALAFIVGVLLLLLISFLELILPQYINGLHSGIILILAGYFMGVVQFLFTLMTALKLSRTLLGSSLLLFVFLSLAYLVLYWFDFKLLIAYAIASFLGWVLYAAILVLNVCQSLRRKKVLYSLFIKSIGIPFLGVLGLFAIWIFVVQHIFPGRELLVNGILVSLFAVAIFPAYKYKFRIKALDYVRRGMI